MEINRRKSTIPSSMKLLFLILNPKNVFLIKHGDVVVPRGGEVSAKLFDRLGMAVHKIQYNILELILPLSNIIIFIVVW